MKKKIAVIGAGILGSAIAYSLSKRQVEVHLFDKQSDLNPPTRYSLAWLNAFNKSPLDYFLFYQMGLHRWPMFHAEIGGGCDLTWGGALSLPTTSVAEGNLETQYAALCGWGYAVERLDRQAMVRLEPNLVLDGVKMGVHCLDEGYVDAAKCTERLRQLAQKNGAKWHCFKEVTKLERKKGRVEAIYIGKDRLEFDEVVLASGETVSALAATAEVQVPQQNVPVFLVETAPCKQRFNSIAVLHLFSEALDGQYLHLRQNRDGSFWIAEVGKADGEYEQPQRYAQKMLHEFARFFKAAQDLSITYHIVTVPKPVDGKAIFGYAPGVNNLYVALSHSAVVIASQIGDWVTHEVLDGTRVHWLEQFRL